MKAISLCDQSCPFSHNLSVSARKRINDEKDKIRPWSFLGIRVKDKNRVLIDSFAEQQKLVKVLKSYRLK